MWPQKRYYTPRKTRDYEGSYVNPIVFHSAESLLRRNVNMTIGAILSHVKISNSMNKMDDKKRRII